jgi:hypothetical protein
LVYPEEKKKYLKLPRLLFSIAMIDKGMSNRQYSVDGWHPRVIKRDIDEGSCSEHLLIA